MQKTPKQVADDILSSLKLPNAPERVLIEVYLEKWEESIRKKAIEEIKDTEK